VSQSRILMADLELVHRAHHMPAGIAISRWLVGLRRRSLSWHGSAGRSRARAVGFSAVRQSKAGKGPV
jgi:hypothetical protein